MLVCAKKDKHKYITGKGFCTCKSKQYLHGKGFADIAKGIINLAIIGKNVRSIVKDLKKEEKEPDPNLVNMIKEITGSGFNLT